VYLLAYNDAIGAFKMGPSEPSASHLATNDPTNTVAVAYETLATRSHKRLRHARSPRVFSRIFLTEFQKFAEKGILCHLRRTKQ
jgi:hypothetical protein